MIKRGISVIALLSLLLLGTSAFAQSSSGEGSGAGDVWNVAGQFRDISFTAFLIGTVFLLWRQLWSVQAQLTQVLERQADWNRAVTPIPSDFRAQGRELARWSERPKTPPFGTSVPVSEGTPPVS